MNRMKNKRAIVVDLDRTLLRSNKTISQYTVDVLNRCKKCGVKIIFATARPQRDVMQFCDIVDFDGLVVSNGAKVLCGDHRTEFFLRPDSAARLLKAWGNIPNLRITLETGDCAYSNRFIEDYPTVICDDLIEVAKSEGVLKLLVHIDSEDVLETVKKDLTEDLYYSVAHGYLMQIMDKSATKWNGIKTLLNLCGCSPEEAAYFGDDHDDIEPIKMCKIGIAVSNGIDEVKAAADFIAESNDEDGVAKFIEQILSTV